MNGIYFSHLPFFVHYVPLLAGDVWPDIPASKLRIFFEKAPAAEKAAGCFP
jgi:hypothetical protein